MPETVEVRNVVARQIDIYFQTLRNVLTERPRDFGGAAAYALRTANYETTGIVLPDNAVVRLKQVVNLVVNNDHARASEYIARAENITDKWLRSEGHIRIRNAPNVSIASAVFNRLRILRNRIGGLLKPRP